MKIESEAVYRAVKETIEKTILARLDTMGTSPATLRQLAESLHAMSDHLARASAQTLISMVSIAEQAIPEPEPEAKRDGTYVAKIVRNDGKAYGLVLADVLVMISALQARSDLNHHHAAILARHIQEFYGLGK